jgi:hypothetical protein
VNPGALISNIGHIKKITIEPCLSDGILEKWFVGSRCTGGNDYPVQLMVFDHLFHLLLGVLRASVKISL